MSLGVRWGVIKIYDKHAIIKLKQEGHSNREIQRLTGTNRKTVSKYWGEYQANIARLDETPGEELREIQERLTAAPRYNAENRKPRKYTPEIDALLDEILAEEELKNSLLGNRHKQKLTGIQIHGIIRAAGHDISRTVVCNHLKEKRDRLKEAFIRQEYDYGQRLEYDFGEVRLAIGGQLRDYYLAVFSSPGAKFRWAYLYHSQKKAVFMDSHVRFFEMAGGAYQEVVYDNMKNVVTRFVGRNEKQLNEDLVKMSLYYGYRVNVTNCFSGNEKGHVENSVKTIRNKVFALRYRFESFEEAESYLKTELLKMNMSSAFEEEKCHLLPYRPPLELAHIAEQRVDKYSFVRVENNFYSVPECLVGRKVLVKNYPTEIVVYSAGNKVCSHKKKEGFHEMSVEIVHYLDTLKRKPGSIKNSVALKCKQELKSLFDKHYTGREREFIGILYENRNQDIDEVLHAVALSANPRQMTPAKTIEDNVTACTRRQMAELSRLFLVGGAAHVH